MHVIDLHSIAFNRTCLSENIYTYSFSTSAPTGSPLGFTDTQHRSRNLTFSWSPPAPTLRNGVITGYSLSCVPEGGGGNSIFMQYTAAGNFTLRGLTPATSYNCSISAINIWGNGPVAYEMVSTLADCKHRFLLFVCLFVCFFIFWRKTRL